MLEGCQTWSADEVLPTEGHKKEHVQWQERRRPSSNPNADLP